ncbi:Zf(Bed)-4 protein, putative [Rhizoctonia solani AG-3 Rhs1AP]|uniref:Zf(Bed)-4 protein, putative n=1 Tax=Rhizoctonia solani AG-3 Rhs1AP TaxID=1086054 RepID=X8J9N7_9AGAM|nr:Zf(Bed)-4 protein, putative [Rhizoctonia solani AG-3 Rhs1AP]
MPTEHPDTGKPTWLFRCKYCDSIRRFRRTDGCSEFSNERQHISATNLVAHLNKCTRLPVEQKLKAVKARLNHPSEPETLTPAQASVASVFRSSPRALVQQPVAISNSLFRSTLIQGVVRDNYPLTFGEGRGMQQVFALTSPHFKLPSHQTMRTDLDKLYDILKGRVLHLLKSQDSRVVVTSDAWTSKTFAYSLGGVVITFIDKHWNYQEFVLDVVHLDADHTGVGMGQRLFKSLDCMGAAANVIASVTDNASNNQTMNAELSKRIREKYEISLRVDNMSVHACACIASYMRAIFTQLKAMDSLESDDMYAAVKSFEEGEVIENSAEVLEEEGRLRSEDCPPGHSGPPDNFDDDLSDLEVYEQPGDSISPQPSQRTPGSEPNNTLNCVQKVHEIAVHITSSAKRRKRMRNIIRALKLEPRAVIKSVRVRWNSILAEIRRALLLKPAFNQYVATLDEGKTGKQQTAARALKKKLTIKDEEWDIMDELVKILEYFESATRAFSVRGRTSLHSVLSTYALLRSKLFEARNRLSALFESEDPFGIIEALAAGERKLEKYFEMAKDNDLTLIASILHPGMRLAHFRDTKRWGSSGPLLTERGQKLLEFLYEDYRLDSQETMSPAGQSTELPGTLPAQKSWLDSLLDSPSEAINFALYPEELRDYFDGRYRYNGWGCFNMVEGARDPFPGP